MGVAASDSNKPKPLSATAQVGDWLIHKDRARIYSASEKVTAFAVARCCEPDSSGAITAFPSIRYLMGLTGLASETVQKSLAGICGETGKPPLFGRQLGAPVHKRGRTFNRDGNAWTYTLVLSSRATSEQAPRPAPAPISATLSVSSDGEILG